ncbi:MAG: ROK family protein, partial [Chordicoccus sp.]
GVGGGIILNGHIFEGGVMGGSEVGHQVIRVNGRLCSCGRKGCLEAYASVPALLKAAEQAAGEKVALGDIFARAKSGDVAMQEVVEQYEQMLGTGIVNIVNMFRPQLVVLGGAISAYAADMLEPLREMIASDAFGGASGTLPEITVAELGSQAGMIGAANL